VSSQHVAPPNTNVLCYENVLLSSPKDRAERNINATKSISTGLNYLNYDFVPQVKCPKGTTEN